MRQATDRADYAERYAQLERENQRLWAELDARTEEIRRRDHIIAGLVERLPALPETTSQDAAVAANQASGQAKTVGMSEDATSPPASVLGRLLRWLRGT